MSVWKKIGMVSLYTVLTAGLGAYFYFATLLVHQQHNDVRCQAIHITVKDSADNPLIDAQEINYFLQSRQIAAPGMAYAGMDMNALEHRVEEFASVRECNAVRTIDGSLQLLIYQHRPLCRLETAQGSFFLSDKGYLFPLVNPYRYPVLPATGELPFNYPAGYRGRIDTADHWMDQLYHMAAFIAQDPFWSTQTAQIQVHSDRSLQIHSLTDSVFLGIGPIDQYAYKLDKLQEFYQVLVPLYGIDKYTRVDAQFGDQLVCTKK